MKKKILIFVEYYIPGFKAGGPLRTIANMVEHLSEDVEFYIVTGDRDLGDMQPYNDVLVNEWVQVGRAQVFYCSPNKQSISSFVHLINSTPHDILYLNSFFSPTYTLKPLLAHSFCKLSNTPVLLAPRGEFSEGALRIKNVKKKIFIFVARLVGLYDDISWHASSEYEVADIKKLFPLMSDNVLVALDLPTKVNLNMIRIEEREEKKDVLKVIFLSRISPKKNLDYALKILSKVCGNIIFDIYGPIEDEVYWVKCQSLISLLPDNIKIDYRGLVVPNDVSEIFINYDLFLFPTHGENYGHVIAEALSVGTPVLLSDQTPWRNLEMEGLGWDLSLDDMERFVEIVELFGSNDIEVKDRVHIQRKAAERLTEPSVLEANKQLFHKSQ